MFEDLTYQDTRGSVDIQKTLISRYKRNQTYSGILKRSTIPNEMKLLLRKPDTKQRILEAIENDIRDPIRPEGVYEIWNKENHNVYRSHEVNKEPVKFDEEYIKKVLENDEALGKWRPKKRYRMDLKMANVNERLKLLNGTLRLKSHIAYLSEINGNECLPDGSRVGFHQYHINNLTFFLHRCIMSLNWNLAYKIFSILIRMRGANLRELWPIGIEILRGKQVTSDADFKSKEQQFLNWLVSYFIIGHNKVEQTSNDPVFKHGTNDHAPMYVIEYYWTLFEEKKFDQVKTGLGNLLIDNPYNKEGVLSYMLGLCFLFENIQLAEEYQRASESANAVGNIIADERTGIFEQINNNFDELEKNLSVCDTLNYEFPKSLIEEQTKMVWDGINKADEQVEISNNDSDVPFFSDDQLSDLESTDKVTEQIEKSRILDNYLSNKSPVDEEFVDPFEDWRLSDEVELQGSLQYKDHEDPGKADMRVVESDNKDFDEQDDDEEEIPDQYDDEEEIPDQYDDEEEIPDQYDDEEEIPDQYEEEEEEEEEIPDQYEDEEIPDQNDNDEIPDQYENEELQDQNNIHGKTSQKEQMVDSLIDEEIFHDANDTFNNNITSRTEVIAASSPIKDDEKKNSTMEFDFEFF